MSRATAGPPNREPYRAAPALATDHHGDHHGARLAYHYLVAVDIESFSRLSTRDQVSVQSDLARTLDEAARRAELDRRTWHRQVGGDGELAVLPTDVNGLRLVADFPRELAQALASVNARRYPEPRIRLRVALHHGTLAPGCLGPVGQAPIVVSRLLDSGLLRKELVRRPDADLVVIVSASIYSDVIETQLGGLDPTEFCRVSVRAKNVAYSAYVHRGHTVVERPAEPPAEPQDSGRREALTADGTGTGTV